MADDFSHLHTASGTQFCPEAFRGLRLTTNLIVLQLLPSLSNNTSRECLRGLCLFHPLCSLAPPCLLSPGFVPCRGFAAALDDVVGFCSRKPALAHCQFPACCRRLKCGFFVCVPGGSCTRGCSGTCRCWTCPPLSWGRGSPCPCAWPPPPCSAWLTPKERRRPPEVSPASGWTGTGQGCAAAWAAQLGSVLLPALELLLGVTRLIPAFVFCRFIRLSAISLSMNRGK